MQRTLITALATLALMLAAIPQFGDADTSAVWKIYRYAPSGQTLSSKQAPADGNAIATFEFLPTPDDALLAMKATTGPNFTLSGKTLSATFTITGTGVFTYYGQPDACGTPASVRFYFNTANGPFAYTKYWWSNPVSAVLIAGETRTISAPVTPSQWSDWNGQFGTTDQAAFEAAAANPDLIGLSFGGGCFFENGVGVTGGPATFRLTDFSIN